MSDPSEADMQLALAGNGFLKGAGRGRSRPRGYGLKSSGDRAPVPRRAFSRKISKFHRDSPMDIPAHPLANLQKAHLSGQLIN